MKKLLIVLSVLFLLTGCGKKEIYGEVLSVTNEGQYVQLVVRTDNDRQVRILADGHTHVYSFAEPDNCKGLLSGDLISPVISVSQMHRQNGAWLAEMICVESVELPEGYTLKDGTKLTLRKDYNYTIYIAPDGTELLREQYPVGPDNVYTGDAPSLSELEPEVQQSILSYYEEIGLLYDLDAELEQAYQWYLKTEDGEPFYSCMVSQHIDPTAANDRFVWYSAYVTHPIKDGLHEETSVHTIFDRKTGAVVAPADLFTCSETEAANRILDAAQMPDTELRREMEKAFRFEYLNFHSNALDICFPAGSLIGEQTNHYLGIDYGNLTGILHTWAIPDSIA